MSRPLSPETKEYQTINISPIKYEPTLNKNNFNLALNQLRIDESQKDLIRSIANNQNIDTYFNLQNCLGGLHDIKDRINLAKVLEYTLCHNTNLTEVNLSGNGFNDILSKKILQSLNLEHNSSLTSLDMSYNEISEGSISVIEDTLRYNSTLNDLGLRNCDINYQQASKIRNALRGNSFITDLDIIDNPFLKYKEGIDLLESIYDVIYYNRNVIFEKGESQLRSSEDNTDSRNSNSTNNSRPANWQSRRNREERIESRKKQLSTLDPLPETDVSSARGSTLDSSNKETCCVLQ